MKKIKMERQTKINLFIHMTTLMFSHDFSWTQQPEVDKNCVEFPYYIIDNIILQ